VIVDAEDGFDAAPQLHRVTTAHLDQPRPHRMGRCRDRDRVGGQRGGVEQEVIPGQCLSLLLTGGTPGLPEPVRAA
jgi:hypothetical protein